MLKLAGEIAPGLEKIESISYSPGIQDSGDLEAATKTITATSEASGVGNADYSSALTLAASPDARLEVLRLAFRLLVTIDSMTAGHLYCRVYEDVQDINHKLYDLDWTTTGAKISTNMDKTSGTIFDDIGDGSAHTFYFFFWVDTGNAVISVVQLQEGVGHTNANGLGQGEVLKLTHTGLAQIIARFMRKGTGNFTANFQHPSGTTNMANMLFSSTVYSDIHVQKYPEMSIPHLIKTDMGIRLRDASVVTDLLYLKDITITLRSEQ